MRTTAEIMADARPGKAFSNGTMGYSWQANWCDRCLHDKGARDGSDPVGCPILGVALLTDTTPAEWMEQPWQQIEGRPEGQVAPRLGDTYHCVDFRDEDEPGPGYEPQPDPPLPGQLELFLVDDQPRVRMFADVAAEARSVVAR